jgi:hypothetical protein
MPIPTAVKSIFTSKVFWLAVVQAVIGILVAIGTSIPNVGWLIVVKSVLDVILRFLTTGPVSVSGN